MNEIDRDLEQRLRRLEVSLPVGAQTLPLTADRRAVRLAGGATGLIASLLLVAGVAAGGVRLVTLATAPGEGLFNPGQPLHCSGVERMTPQDADRFLRAQGYDVTWQIEDRDPRTPYRLSETPPERGFVIDGVAHGVKLTMIVEVGENAEPVHKDC